LLYYLKVLVTNYYGGLGGNLTGLAGRFKNGVFARYSTSRYLFHLSFLVVHSANNPINNTKINRVIVMFCFVCVSCLIGKGNSREISISKIRKRIMTRKNCMENLLCDGT
jgi:hypothetical protein